jgi:hypothetical protein
MKIMTEVKAVKWLLLCGEKQEDGLGILLTVLVEDFPIGPLENVAGQISRKESRLVALWLGNWSLGPNPRPEPYRGCD